MCFWLRIDLSSSICYWWDCFFLEDWKDTLKVNWTVLGKKKGSDYNIWLDLRYQWYLYMLYFKLHIRHEGEVFSAPEISPTLLNWCEEGRISQRRKDYRREWFLKWFPNIQNHSREHDGPFLTSMRHKLRAFEFKF